MVRATKRITTAPIPKRTMAPMVTPAMQPEPQEPPLIPLLGGEFEGLGPGEGAGML